MSVTVGPGWSIGPGWTIDGGPVATGSMNFTPAAAYLQTPVSSPGSTNINLLTGGQLTTSSVFTLEAFINITSFNGTKTGATGEESWIIGNYTADLATTPWGWNVQSNGYLQLFIYNGSYNKLVATTTQLSEGVWYYVAMTIDGSSVYLFVNGVLQTNQASGTNIITTNVGSSQVTDQLTLGSSSAGRYFNGYMTSVRVTKSALYTSGFSAPSAPLPNIANTSLLLQVNSAGAYLADSSNNNFSMTNSGVIYSTLHP